MASNVIEFIVRAKDEFSKTFKGSLDSANASAKNLQNTIATGLSKAGFEDLGAAINKIPLGLAAVGAGAGAIVALGKFAVDAAQSYADLAIQFDQLGQKTGAGVEFLSSMSAAANDAEISTDQFSAAMVKFSDNLFSTQGASANVQMELYALADAFAQMEDGPQKTAMAIDAFGKAGATMIPLLNQGSEGLKALQADMSAMGRTITAEGVEAANRFDDAMDKLNGRMQGLTMTIGGNVLPALTGLLSAVDTTITGMDQLTRTGAITGEGMSDLAQRERDLAEVLIGLHPALSLVAKAMGGLPPVANAAGNAALQAGSKVIASGNMALSGAAAWSAAVQRIFAAQGSIATFNFSGVTARYAGAMKSMEENTRKQANFQIFMSGKSTELQIANQNRLAGEYGRTNEIIEQSFKKSFGGGGGAASSVKELTDEMKGLEDRTNSLKSALSKSTDEMDDGEKLQTAFAIATGELTVEQFAQEQAVKGLLEAVKQQKITNEQALTTVLAMREGFASTGDAFGVAGEAGNKYKGELDNVTGVVDAAKKKVNDMGTAIKNLPENTQVDVTATVLGKPAVDALKSTVDGLNDKTVTVTVVTRSVDQSGGTVTVDPGTSGGGNGGGTNRGGTVFTGARVVAPSNSKTLTYISAPVNYIAQDPRKAAAYFAGMVRQSARAAALRAQSGMG